MFKTVKGIINNLNEGPFIKNMNNLQMYRTDMNAKNRILLDKDSNEVKCLRNLESIIRYKNLNIYMKNMFLLKCRKHALTTVPAILTAGTIAFSLFGEFTKVEEKSAYQRRVIEFDEENIYVDQVDDKYYVPADLIEEINDDNLVGVGNYGIVSDANFYFGNDTNVTVLNCHISDNDAWSYYDDYTTTYVPLDENNRKKIADVSDHYKNLIKVARDLINNHYGEGNHNVNFAAIDECINNDLNDIFVSIQKYEKVGNVEVVRKSFHGWYLTLFGILDIIYFLSILLRLFYPDERKKFFTIPKLYATGVILNDDKVENYNLLHSELLYNEAFLFAERNRIEAIYKLLVETMAETDILSNYEKKLLNGEKKLIKKEKE